MQLYFCTKVNKHKNVYYIVGKGFSRDTCKTGHVVKFGNGKELKPLIYRSFKTVALMLDEYENITKNDCLWASLRNLRGRRRDFTVVNFNCSLTIYGQVKKQ